MDHPKQNIGFPVPVLPALVVLLMVLFPVRGLAQLQKADSLERSQISIDTVRWEEGNRLAEDKALLVDSALADTLTALPGEAGLPPDTLPEEKDSLGQASRSVAEQEAALGIRISADALPAKVVTKARDSAVLNMTENKFYLYGEAEADYEALKINSGVMIYDQQDNILKALPVLDTAGKVVSLQQFIQAEEKFTYDTLEYNFKSKRALVRNARSEYGEGFVISEQIKRNADETIFGWHNLYTTCNLPHPHFGIRANKIKVVPGRIIASGWANLEIQDVPTPLILPFGLFPIKQGQRSGFIMPSYTLEDNRGLGLQRGGYYLAINEHLGMINQFDMYSKGSWSYFGTLQYAMRYRYSGNLAVNYGYFKTGDIEDPNATISRDFRVTWSHQVDPRARPGSSFSASVNFGTSSYNQYQSFSVANALDNQYNSSISYSKSWVGKPYSFTAALRHNQSTQSRRVTVSFPEMNFNLGQFTPFQRKNRVGVPKWYEKISVQYSVEARNNWNFYDSTLNINKLSFSDFDNGIRHNASINASYNIFRFINWSIGIPYTEYWNTKQQYLYYNPDTRLNDTTINNGFFATRDFSINTSLNTRIYGLKMFPNARYLMGIRHVMTPRVGFTYQPGFAAAPFGYMYETMDVYGAVRYESPYAYSPVGGPRNPLNSGSVNFELNNTLQVKVRSGRDTVNGSKNVSLIDALRIGASYNTFADSFNWSNITMSFSTSILQKINITGNASWDPYLYNADGRRTSELLIDHGKGVADLRTARLGFGMNWQGGAGRKNVTDTLNTTGDSELSRLLANNGYQNYYDFNIPWDLSINGGLSVSRNKRQQRTDTLIFTPNLTFNGGFNLTERWRVSFYSGIEFTGFKEMRMGNTSIDITRDLHCWQMSLNLVPFGFYRSFHFTLQVKASILQDLKLIRRRAFQDNY